jgi:hypothetical protein
MQSKQLVDEKKAFSELIRQTQVSAKISRLFAQENITVEYSSEAKTASFDVVRRVLTYPYSMVLEDEVIHDLLMGHEIGHARFTKTADEMRMRSSEQIFEYWNIVEDIRIEKLQKRDYPGLTATFQQGYLRLYQKGWFGSQRQLSIGTFATRLNFFCKAGPITAWFIKFNDAERDFLRRCEEVELEEDVHKLAIELSEMAGHDRKRARELLLAQRRELAIERAKWAKWREQFEQKPVLDTDPEPEEEQHEEDITDEEGIVIPGDKKSFTVDDGKTVRQNDDDADLEDRDEEDLLGGTGSISRAQGEGFVPEEPELSEEDTELEEEDIVRFEETLSRSDEYEIDDAMRLDPLEKFNKSFSESRVQDAKIYVYESIDKREVNIPDARGMYRAFVKQLGIRHGGHYWAGESNTLDYLNEKSVEARKSLKKAVDYLARQFDAKKAAVRAKHAVISTSGQLDINRAFAHRYSEDIFLKKMHIRDAKNHGIILLLDASGSIDSFWLDMVKQVLLITEFCRKVQIPFKVFIFGQSLQIDIDEQRPHPVNRDEPKEQTDVSHPLLGYARDPDAVLEVLSSEQTTPEYRTMVGALLQQAFFRLGGTPTVNAMLNIEANVTEFFLRYNVSIKKLMIITDGGAGDGCSDLKHSGTRCFVSDPKTRKNYYIQGRREYYDQTPVDIIAKIFRDRYGMDTMFIALGHKKDVKRSVAKGRRYKWTETKGMAKSFGLLEDIEPEELYKAHTKHNFLLKETPLGLPVFFVKPTAAETEIRMQFTESMTTKEIAAAFADGMASLKKSQTFLSILMKHIAVEIEA